MKNGAGRTIQPPRMMGSKIISHSLFFRPKLKNIIKSPMETAVGKTNAIPLELVIINWSDLMVISWTIAVLCFRSLITGS